MKAMLTKILSLLLVVTVTAGVAIGGTLAWLTDRDSEANVFTVGNVEIDLEEDFDQGATLIPGVKIEKEPTITNTGKNDAWVWAEIAIPAVLDSSNDASQNVVHFNYNKDYVNDTMWTWKDADGWMVREETMNGVVYNVYTALYQTALKPDAVTEPVITKVYMDTNVDIDPNDDWYIVENGVATGPYWNSEKDGNPVIYVSAYAMQTEGFLTVQDAYAAYTEQWTTEENVNNGLEWASVVNVTNSEELTKAVADGATTIVLADGEYVVDNCGGKTLNLIGSKDAVIKVMNEGEDGCDYGFGSSSAGIGNVTFNGVTIDTTSNTGNYKGFAYMKGTFNNCNFVGAYSLNNANDFEFNNCTFDFQNGYFWTWGANSVTFNDCTFNGNSKCILAHGYASTVINIADCTFAATEQGYTGSGDWTAVVEIDPAGSNTYTINFTGENTKTENYNGWTRIKDNSTGHDITPPVDNSIDTWDGTADTSWYNETDTEFVLTTAEQLAGLAELVAGNVTFDGKTITLGVNMDLYCEDTTESADGDPLTFRPIGDISKKGTFEGTFDGNGKTIENLYQNGWDLGYQWGVYGSYGLFGNVNDATIKNLTISGSESIIEGGDVSFVTGSATGTCVFENITIKDSAAATYNNGCGGIIGWSGQGNYTFKNITIAEDAVLAGLWGSFDSSIGGIVGQGEPGATYNFENVNVACRLDCYNDVTAAYKYYLYRMTGMLIGRLEETTTINGSNYPDMSKYNITCKDVTVTYGDWMNYHYCVVAGKTAWRCEAGYAYGGIPADHDHSTCAMHCNLLLPFDGLFGGDQYGVKPITEYEGVTVNYPTSYNPEG